MKKRILSVLFLITFSLVLSGCWDYEEYEDMVQVVALGMDYNNKTKETTVTIQYIPTVKTSGGTGGTGGMQGTPSSQVGVVHSATAKTFFLALNKLQEVILHKIFFGYLRIIVVGNEAAKYNMQNLVELFDRTPNIRNNAYLVIASGKAEDTLSTIDPSHVSSSREEIYNLVQLSDQTGSAIPVSFLDFTGMLAVGGLEGTAPRIITVSRISHPQSLGGEMDKIKFDEQREGDQRIAGMAAFKEDKFIGWLNERESFGLRMILGKNTVGYESSPFTAQMPIKDILTYHDVHTKSKIKPKIEHGQPVINVNIKVVADLRKYYAHGSSEYIGPSVIKEAEKKLTASVKADVQDVLKKGQQEMKSDIFGFGFAFFRKYPKLWQTEYEKKWPQIFPGIKVVVKIDAKVINTGTNIKEINVK